MARIRTIKPEFWRNPELSTVSPETALLAIGLLNVADDEGWFFANENLLKADIFPLRECSLSIHGGLTDLSNIGYIRLFLTPDGRRYGHIVNFSKHQKINRPTPSKIKGLQLLTEDSLSTHGGLTAGKERKGKEKDIQRNSFAEEISSKPKQKTQSTEQQEMFDKLWDAYGKKDGKTAAVSAFSKLKVKPEVFGHMMSCVKVYVSRTPDKKYRKHLSTFLNDKTWTDEENQPSKKNDSPLDLGYHIDIDGENQDELELQRML
jgi:hypothetical protein